MNLKELEPQFTLGILGIGQTASPFSRKASLAFYVNSLAQAQDFWETTRIPTVWDSW